MNHGEMAERLNAAVSKTVILGNRYREFESLSLRLDENPLELFVLRDFCFLRIISLLFENDYLNN